MTFTINETYLSSIETTWYGQTNHRGSRVKATAGMGRTVWVAYEYGCDEMGFDTHDIAARKLMDKMGWNWNLLRAGKPDGKGFVYVAVVRTEPAPSVTPAQPAVRPIAP